MELTKEINNKLNSLLQSKLDRLRNDKNMIDALENLIEAKIYQFFAGLYADYEENQSIVIELFFKRNINDKELINQFISYFNNKYHKIDNYLLKTVILVREQRHDGFNGDVTLVRFELRYIFYQVKESELTHDQFVAKEYFNKENILISNIDMNKFYDEVDWEQLTKILYFYIKAIIIDFNKLLQDENSNIKN